MAKPKTESDNTTRPCCQLLQTLSKSLSSLENPFEVAQALEKVKKNCILMQLMGESPVKWDLSKSTCYLARSPDAEAIVDEMGKTAAVHAGLKDHHALLNHMNGILANNAKLKQTTSRMQVFLAKLREGETKFGAVPDTDLSSPRESLSNTLSAGALLKGHPSFKDKPQSEGMPPKVSPKNNPEAEKNADAIRNELQNRPVNAPKPSAAPTLRR
jgi:hypothetical protein